MPVFFFDVVDLLLVIGSPKVGIDKSSVVLVEFDPFGDAKVFPKSTHIRSEIHFIEVADHGVADSHIIEVDFLAFSQFLP